MDPSLTIQASIQQQRERTEASEAGRMTRLRIENFRREYLNRHPEYLDEADHEFAGPSITDFMPRVLLMNPRESIIVYINSDPLFYDRTIRRFQSARQREEAVNKNDNFASAMERNIRRTEAKLEAKEREASQSTHDTHSTSEAPFQRFGSGALLSMADDITTADEGRAQWYEFLRDRFIRGEDADFDYGQVDNDDGLDVVERDREQEAWFDEEEPDWVEDEESQAQPVKNLQGETGVQDY